MMGLVMAGGRGARMGGGEKLLLASPGPVVMRAVNALRDSGCIADVAAVTSPNSPLARDLLQKSGVRTIDSPGAGYAEDLYRSLKYSDGPALVVSGDMPLLDGEIVRRIASLYDGSAWTVIVCGSGFLQSLKLEPGPEAGPGLHYTGVSLVNPAKVSSPDAVEERQIVLNDRRIAFNLNTKSDYELFCAL